MDSQYYIVRNQTLQSRTVILKILESLRGYEDEIPPKWNNNALWHAGHLVITNRLLTYKLMGEKLGYSDDYRDWFKKGSDPSKWSDAKVKPDYEEILPEIIKGTEELFDDIQDVWDEPYPEEYTTSLGVVLTNPREALNFSMFHDGIHLGMLLALRRAMSVS